MHLCAEITISGHPKQSNFKNILAWLKPFLRLVIVGPQNSTSSTPVVQRVDHLSAKPPEVLENLAKYNTLFYKPNVVQGDDYCIFLKQSFHLNVIVVNKSVSDVKSFVRTEALFAV